MLSLRRVQGKGVFVPRLSGMFAAGGYYMRNYLSESNSNDYFEIKQLTGLDKVSFKSTCSA
jgi:hypothetical protein